MQNKSSLPNNSLKNNFWKKNSLLLSIVGFITIVSSVLGLAYNLIQSPEPSRVAQASEPACQTVANSPTWNPYPISTSFANPILTAGNCRDMPMLSFFPVDTASGNPRQRNILSTQNFSIHLYYNNGATPGSSAIQDPRTRIQFRRISDTQYRISAELSGSNTGTVTSAQKGGDLIVNVPQNTRFDIVARSTDHYPDAIERRQEADRTGRAPNDQINDNSANGVISNPIYSEFLDKNLTSTNGFQIKSGGLESGFLGYGYILTTISANVDAQPENNPPTVNGEEMTIVRGESGTFAVPITPNDPDGDFPVSVDTSDLPSSCTVNGAPNPQGGGQTITCNTDENTPDRFTFDLIPTDSRGLVGAPGTWIVNVIEPDLNPEKICLLRGTDQECNTATLTAGDEITYIINVENSSSVNANNLRIVDTYDGTRIDPASVSNISDGGVHNSSANTITWNNLGTLNAGSNREVRFDATVSDNVQLGDLVVNTAVVSADGFPEEAVTAEFTIGGNLDLLKRCFVRGTTTPCETGQLTAGDDITYEVQVTNSTDSEVTNVVLTDTYDREKLTNITNINPDATTTDLATGTITWNLGTLAVDQSETVSFDATIADLVQPGSLIRNVAVVTADNLPSIEVDNEFRIIGPVLDAEKLCFRRGTSTPCSQAGMLPSEAITYIIRTTNNGTVTAQNVVVTDTYDRSRLTSITNIEPTGTLDEGNGRITWSLGNLDPGRTVETRFEATIKPDTPTGTSINNIVVVGADNVEGIRREVAFAIRFVGIETPRTGGGLALVVVALLVGIGGAGYYYYQKYNKFSSRFVPARSSEESKTESKNKAKSSTKAHIKAHIKTPNKKK